MNKQYYLRQQKLTYFVRDIATYWDVAYSSAQ